MTAQLALDHGWTERPKRRSHEPRKAPRCADCHAREARYGFRTDADAPWAERPRTLCFECFRAELGRRSQAQVRLPLEHRLDALARRRRHAQIEARHALQLR
jgi:hypothetical protein